MRLKPDSSGINRVMTKEVMKSAFSKLSPSFYNSVLTTLSLVRRRRYMLDMEGGNF